MSVIKIKLKYHNYIYLMSFDILIQINMLYSMEKANNVATYAGRDKISFNLNIIS